MHIFVSLLKQMAPEHLLATSAKLCAEILAAASDGLLNVDDVTGQSVVQVCYINMNSIFNSGQKKIICMMSSQINQIAFHFIFSSNKIL